VYKPVFYLKNLIFNDYGQPMKINLTFTSIN
jgi:hypothetical protein